MAFKIRCLACMGYFKVGDLDDVPTDCPQCGAFINQKEMPEVAAPALFLMGGERTRVIDKVYTDAEKASEVRMERAAEMTPGAQKSDFADLKITNYRSGMGEGESAVPAPQVSKEFANNVAALKSGGVQVQNNMVDLSGQTAAFSTQTRSGPEPNAGVRAMDRLRGAHRNNVDPRMNGAISSIPALETQSPTYVPRGAPIIPGVGR